MTYGSPHIRIKTGCDKSRGSRITSGELDDAREGRLVRRFDVLGGTVSANFRPGRTPAASATEGRDRRRSRGAELDCRQLGAVLSTYTQRIMYRKAMVAGAARVDLDGNPAGEVSAKDAEHAAAKLAETLASRQAKQAAAEPARRAERIAKQPALPAAAPPPAARPVLRLPAFRQQCG